MDEVKTVWKERAADTQSVAAFISRGENEVIARILANRGVSVDGYDEYIAPPQELLKYYLASPDSLPGIDRAVDVILPFVKDGEKQIVVYGDYDADGVCATAIIVKTLSALGAKRIDAFFPNRFTEGYGMTPVSIERMLTEHPDTALVITADNGITSAVEIAELRKRGITVVVTDHHIPGNSVPDADALVNPQVAADQRNALLGLSGAGVAFFLSNALVKSAVEHGIYSGGKLAAPLVVLAGLATVADLMPLTEQNRLIVKSALYYFSKSAPVGLNQLLQKAARSAYDITSRDFAYMLAPRINAAGRMDSAKLAYDLLMTGDVEQARMHAVKLDGINISRKTAEKDMQKDARGQIDKHSNKFKNVVVVSDLLETTTEWNSGVAGIVAARLMDEFQKPVAVIVGGHGSVRAPEGYNVHEALNACSEALDRFGGHACAGGLSILSKDVAALEKFTELFDKVCAEQRSRRANEFFMEYDALLEPEYLKDMRFYEELQKLEPIGESNPAPVFVMEKVHFKKVSALGAEKKHLNFSICKFDGAKEIALPRAVWWKADKKYIDELADKSEVPEFFDIMFCLTTSDYGGVAPHIELIIQSVRRHTEKE